MSSGADLDYQSIKETVIFGPNKTYHESVVKILRSGAAAGIRLSAVTLSTENDYGIVVEFVNGHRQNLIYWVQ